MLFIIKAIQHKSSIVYVRGALATWINIGFFIGA